VLNPVVQLRALRREGIRVPVRWLKPFRTTLTPSCQPFPARLDALNSHKNTIASLGRCLITDVASPKTKKTSLRLHSSDRHASGFLQVVPIESAAGELLLPVCDEL
jgi:hypothetical protein